MKSLMIVYRNEKGDRLISDVTRVLANTTEFVTVEHMIDGEPEPVVTTVTLRRPDANNVLIDSNVLSAAIH